MDSVTVDVIAGMPDASDLRAARAVYAAAFGQAPYNEPAERADEFVERVRRWIRERQGTRVALARGPTGVVGMALAVTATPGTYWRDSLADELGSDVAQEIFGDEALEVVHVAVLPQAAGQGIGRAVLRALEASAHEPRGVLCVSVQAPAAVRLYESEGWRHVADLPSDATRQIRVKDLAAS